MLNWFKKLFGSEEKKQVQNVVGRGAIGIQSASDVYVNKVPNATTKAAIAEVEARTPSYTTGLNTIDEIQSRGRSQRTPSTPRVNVIAAPQTRYDSASPARRDIVEDSFSPNAGILNPFSPVSIYDSPSNDVSYSTKYETSPSCDTPSYSSRNDDSCSSSSSSYSSSDSSSSYDSGSSSSDSGSCGGGD